MLFNLCLYLKGIYMTSALVLIAAYFIVASIKEKRDERKRV